MKKRAGLALCVLLMLLTILPAGCGKKTELKRINENECFPFEGTLLETGEELDALYLAGSKLNLLTVWQPGCPPCEEELHYLEGIAGKYEGLAIIPLAVAETQEDAEEAFKEWGINLPAVYCSDAFFDYLQEKQGLKRTPTMYFLDAEGYELRESMVGFKEENQEELLSVLAALES